MATKKKATKVEEVNTTPEMEFEDEVKEEAVKDPTTTAHASDGEPEQAAEVLHPITKVCVECGKEFTISPAEQKFFKKMGYEFPKRCTECRDANKKEVHATCVDCGAEFTMKGSEINFYKKFGFEIPKRCPSCRNFKKIRNERTKEAE